MTACVDNKEKKGGAAKAVSATLAGVLAVGMVPAVAFATPDGSEEATDEIELFSAEGDEAWAQGAITKAVDQNGNPVDLATWSPSANGSDQYIIPTEYTPKGGSPISLLDENGKLKAGYSVTYFKAKVDADGEFAGFQSTVANVEFNGQDPHDGLAALNGLIADPGMYYVKVLNENDVKSPETVFSILPASLDGVVAYEVKDGIPTNVSDVEINYTGTEMEFGDELNLAIDGIALEEGTHYEVKEIIPLGGTFDGTHGTSVKDAGKYSAKIAGIGAYAGTAEYKVDFEVKSLDLSTADIEIGTGNVVPYGQDILNETINRDQVRVNGVLVHESGAYNISTATGAATVGVEYVSNEPQNYGGWETTKGGTYVLNVKDTAAADANVAGNQQVTVVAVQNVADVTYDTTNPFHGQTLELNLEDGDEFDTDLIKVMNGGTEIKDYELTVTKGGAASSVDEMNTTSGWYEVNVKVNPGAGYTTACNETMTVHVINGEIDAAKNIFVAYQGTVTNDIDAVYDGGNVLDDVTIRVENEKGVVLAEGTDYEVTYVKFVGTNPSLTTINQSVAVDEMVNAGEYGIVISEAGYDVTNGSKGVYDFIPVTISAIDVALDNAELCDKMFVTRGWRTFVPYTGSEIVPVIDYTNTKDANNSPVYQTLPAGAYQITSVYKWNGEWDANSDGAIDINDGRWEETDEPIQATGWYKIDVKDVAGDSADAVNYDVYDMTFIFLVSDADIFSDVLENEWYTDYVYNAARVDYMNGYAGTDIFGPHNWMLRGEAATVLFRMAGGNAGDPDAYEDLYGTASTIFEDVDASLYYDTPIAWAYKAGVITGYQDGSGEFRPDNSITREEFCTMLYRYAEKTNQLGVTEPADLSAYPDADSVSWWAQDAVEWAVANEIFGGDVALRPNDNISRAEVAKMIVTLQANPLVNWLR